MYGIDGEFIFCDHNITLSVKRFIISNPGNANEVFGDKEYNLSVAFDGELYNIRRLIQRLGLDDSATDANVVAKLFSKYGKESFDMLDGMFSCAIFNHSLKELTLVRDRAGEKPLYYSLNGKGVKFSSDLNDMVRCGGIKKEINKTALCQYFQLGYIFAPLTIYENIFHLEPGHCLTVKKDGSSEDYEYFKIHCDQQDMISNYGECKKRLRNTLIESVEQCIEPGKATGVFLSGGIDSTVITGIASTILNKKTESFTIGFPVKSYDESDRALIAANAHHTSHHVFILEFDYALEKLNHILNSMSQPFADTSTIPTYIVNEYAKKYLDIVLTGDASDQIFAGSSKYLVNYYASKYNRLPAFIRKGLIEKAVYAMPDDSILSRKLRKVISSAEMDVYRRREHMLSLVLKNNELPFLFKDGSSSDGMDGVRAIYDRFENTADELTQTLFTDVKVVVEGGMLAKMGSMSRLAGIETRIPMVSKNMLDLAFRIPSEYKLKGKTGKYILRDTFSDMIPDKLKTASKKGFGVPLDLWFRGPLKDTLLEMLNRDFIEEQGIFNYAYVKKILEEHFSKKVNRTAPLWALYVFQSWYRSNFLS